MCGIAGIVGKIDTHQALRSAERMAACLAKRGPDYEGLTCWPNAVIAHRRLAIFDLSPAGAQPMLSEDGKIGVVFNGAIYNFRILRRELEAMGFAFRSETDTEVLVHGYVAWGIEALVSKLHGIFAFGLWDEGIQKLFLVRDRLGVKPLVYAVEDGRLAFASTAAALEAGGFAGDLDPLGVLQFLDTGFLPDSQSIYRAVKKLPPAHILEWQVGRFKLKEYWRPPSPRPARAKYIPSFNQAVEETERLLIRAVEMRLQADVPVGALLSSGIDSGLVCWALAKLGSDITAFTVSTPGDPWDEGPEARLTAARLGIRHRVLVATPDVSASIEDLIAAFGEPFACASALGMLAVSQVVRQEAKVLLTGDGGDDVFMGYLVHPRLFLAQQVARYLPDWVQACKVPKPLLSKLGLRRLIHFIDYATGGLDAVTNVASRLPWYTDHKVLGERLLGIRVQQTSIPRSLASARRLLDDFVEYHRRMVFVGEYLTKVDGATMHYGIEARSPFLDQDLWAFASSLPYEIRLKAWRKKAILRCIAARRIGKDIGARPKRGFGIPVQRWIAGSWRDQVRESFHSSVLEEDGWINSKPVLEMLRTLPSNQPVPEQVWYLYVLERWMKRMKRLSHPATALTG
jgi:asparagine synthase (glutamine-hydrolysing)